MELVFLGTGAGNGVPVFYCGCPVCEEAQGDARLRRTRSAVAVVGDATYLIDAPPELSVQLMREGICRIDGLFLTHAHHDHCAGLGDLEIYARYHLKAKLPAVMTKETLEELEKSHGSLKDWLQVTLVAPGVTLKYPGIEFTALPASHAPGTLGYLINTAGVSTAYLPDNGPLTPWCAARLRGVDNLVLDATFHGENWYPQQHLAVHEAIRIGRELAVKRLYLTHMSMHYSEPVTSAALEQEIAAYDSVHLAYDGLRLGIGG
ncbi:MBL fold metallo-hydrolase [Geomonas azotofigens]|uniref:MBL fold metallo-hydrolase n=1 Tax=Geomonas azotofigens TaxID=2843196 RepID=UPI001C128B4D|nr:MBL fold metallo-hydrolase [Geomonas azotofigens]MBU5613849.1 MBL fold metallo-hydrolase [Geomonas azotofigens]